MTLREEIIGNCRLICGNCLDVMPTLGKVDAVIVDPPYGTTRCKWDTIIPFDAMWHVLNQCLDKNAPVLIFGSEPFSSCLRVSNLDCYKYDWIWHKPKATGFLNAKRQPLRAHEFISVFCDGVTPYNPQKTIGHKRKTSLRRAHLQTDVYGEMRSDYHYSSTERYPTTVIKFSSDTQNTSLHPTQKPVALMEYLIRTYTNPGDTVLDFAMGSGTAGVACVKTGRSFVGLEIDEAFFNVSCQRILEAYEQPDMFVPHGSLHNIQSVETGR